MEKELDVARTLAVRAGTILLEHYASPEVSWKGQNDPVTQADRAASAFLVRELRSAFPDDGILSEEEPDNLDRLSKSRVWIIDPMDGTAEFIAHTDEFAVMIGLAVDGVPQLGVVFQPVTGQLYYAARGRGAFLNHKAAVTPLHVSSESDPANMTIALSRSHDSPRVRAIQHQLKVPNEIRSGSIGLKVGLICERRAHFYVHLGGRTYQWDSCAPEAILHEAGGRMTDIEGHPLAYNVSELRNMKGLLASNNTIHSEISGAAQSVVRR